MKKGEKNMESIWILPTLTDEQRALFLKLRQNPKLSLIPDLSLEHLIRKGFVDESDIYHLFYDTFHQLHDFRLLQDGPKAIQLIREAIEKGQKIILYSDYDCDGVIGASLGVLGLRYLGANVYHHTNNRFTEGYGMNVKGLRRLFKTHADASLIVTIDNGISVTEEIVQMARTYGAKVVITDHHEPPADGSLPSADAVVNAKRLDNTYPFRELCGAGLFYKLLIALAWEMNKDMQPIYELADFAGIATVGDVVPLVNENRIIVKESLRLIREERRPIFRFLREAAGVVNVDEETYGFTYAPLINAVGRITGEVSAVIEMFTSDNEEWQKQMAKYLVDMNNYRKDLTLQQQQLALDLMQSQMNDPIIVLKDHQFHEGIVGLIAGQLKEKFYRPVFIIADETEEEPVYLLDENGKPVVTGIGRPLLDVYGNPLLDASGQPILDKLGEPQIKYRCDALGNPLRDERGQFIPETISVRKVKGSARSIDGFHLKEILDECKEFLPGYGGHAAAAGLSVYPDQFEALANRLRQLATEKLNEELLTEKISVDMVITEDDLTFDLMDQLNAMRPFGVGFEKPVLALTPFDTTAQRYMGKEQQHLRLTGQKYTAILFNHAQIFKEMGEPESVEVLGFPSVNVWQGQTSLQFSGRKICQKQQQLF